MGDSNHGAFDGAEQEILSNLVVEDVLEEETGNGLPAEPTQPEPQAAAPAPQVPTNEEVKPAAQAEPEAKTDPATPEPAQPQGDPRAALRASRRAEKRLRDEVDQLRQENEALKQGKGPVDTSISDAELAQLDVDFPVQAKIVRKQRELEQQLASNKPEPVQPDFEPMSYDPDLQEVIDGVPDLVAWQYDHAAQDKFQRAISYDKALQLDPDWKDRDLAERFAEATRRTKAALAPATPATPSAPRIDPATVIANAPVEGPKGISDFRGGAPANAPVVNYQGMSDEQIMASLPVT